MIAALVEHVGLPPSNYYWHRVVRWTPPPHWCIGPNTGWCVGSITFAHTHCWWVGPPLRGTVGQLHDLINNSNNNGYFVTLPRNVTSSFQIITVILWRHNKVTLSSMWRHYYNCMIYLPPDDQTIHYVNGFYSLFPRFIFVWTSIRASFISLEGGHISTEYMVTCPLWQGHVSSNREEARVLSRRRGYVSSIREGVTCPL